MKRIISLLILCFTLTIMLNAQSMNDVPQNFAKILDSLSAKYGNYKARIDIISFDFDHDGDLDYVFEDRFGEGPNCLIFINKNGKLEKINEELGYINFNIENSDNEEASNIILNIRNRLCCGESPFTSYRTFIVKNEKIILIDNFVSYSIDYDNECTDNLMTIPYKDNFLNNPYYVKIMLDKYNVRFCADLNSHPAVFVCEENTNIIGKLKKGSKVKVLAEYSGTDSEYRKWLYVEISENNLIFESNENSDYECDNPMTFGNKNQKLRAWISDKYTSKVDK